MCKVEFSARPNFLYSKDCRTRYANTADACSETIVNVGTYPSSARGAWEERWAAACTNSGWRIGVVTTRSIPTARAAVRVIGAGHPSDRLTRQVLASDVVLIAVPDRAIAGVAAELAQLGGSEWRGKVVLHTSGALDSSALGALADAGAATGSIHPMQTFSSQSMPNLAGRDVRH